MALALFSSKGTHIHERSLLSKNAYQKEKIA